MEKKLREHDEKKGVAGWKNDNSNDLYQAAKKKLVEVEELIPRRTDPEVLDEQAFIGKLVDMMNMTMMTIDQLDGFAILPNVPDFAGATVPFRPDRVRDYLDDLIRHWRWNEKRNEQDDNTAAVEMATHYTDAYQSVRMSIFGNLLSGEDD